MSFGRGLLRGTLSPFSLRPRSANRPNVVAAWDELLGRSTSLNCLWQSQEWWDHLETLETTMPRRLGVVQDGGGDIVGVVPLQIGTHPISFQVGNRVLWRRQFNTIIILGSHPLLLDDESAYRTFFRALWDAFPAAQAIHMRSLMRRSFCWQCVEAARAQRDEGYFPYAERRWQSFYSIKLPATFDEYLQSRTSEQRRGFRRRAKTLAKCLGGEAELERIETPEQVAHFLRLARGIFDRSWNAATAFPLAWTRARPHSKTWHGGRSCERISWAREYRLCLPGGLPIPRRISQHRELL